MEEDKYFIHSSGFGMEMQPGELNSASEQQLHNCFFNPVDQNDPFESAMSSIVSSPTASHAAGEGVLLRELIGRLGSICNSGEMSPASYINSTNTSGYNTPMNSPPKLSLMDQQMRGSFVGPQLPSHPTVTPFPPKIESRVCSGHSFKVSGSHPAAKARPPENAEVGDSRQGSSVSEQIPAADISINPPNDGNVRKRKSIPRGKAKEAPSISARDTKIAADNEDSKAKKSKQETATGNGKVKEETTQKQAKDDNSKLPEPPKDYIHVRARRGQATDSHSLAERVRREKISERMKFLQDLVPGCNKVTGKAVMLDEIINYVQSLQCQVEFLSMKLSTVNPRMDLNMEAVLSKEILQSCGSLPQQGAYPLDSSVPALPYGYIPQQLAGIPNGTSMTLPRMDGFGEASAPPQVSGFWEDDLQSLLQMGFVPNQSPNLHGSMASAQMKLEL